MFKNNLKLIIINKDKIKEKVIKVLEKLNNLKKTVINKKHNKESDKRFNKRVKNQLNLEKIELGNVVN